MQCADDGVGGAVPVAVCRNEHAWWSPAESNRCIDRAQEAPVAIEVTERDRWLALTKAPTVNRHSEVDSEVDAVRAGAVHGLRHREVVGFEVRLHGVQLVAWVQRDHTAVVGQLPLAVERKTGVVE